ncbi:unnamed protein product [Allacma fusca]|uniref:Uncharacterized protein n=1 Tax=Allacma fusca TaxID=39272 RepID=A0A8J2PAQ1_9HEXA|nr:unnamed protein product [Allacma fusca]
MERSTCRHLLASAVIDDPRTNYGCYGIGCLETDWVSEVIDERIGSEYCSFDKMGFGGIVDEICLREFVDCGGHCQLLTYSLINIYYAYVCSENVRL